MTPASETPVLLVGVAGGSGSGKSCLTRALASTLGDAQVALLSHDAYYLDRSSLSAAERERIDYDVPDAIDHVLFLDHLAALRAGRAVRPPVYCYVTHRRLGTDHAVAPQPVVLVEGMLLLWDPAVRTSLDLTIYLDAPESVRLQRRVTRDVAERGRNVESVLGQFQVTVRPAHTAYVEPTRAMADLVLSTTGPIQPLAEIAAALILDRLGRRAAGGHAKVA